MLYVSQPLPLEFWTRLQARIEAEYRAQRARLAEMLKPCVATVDTGERSLHEGPQARSEALQKVFELEHLQVLLMMLAGQVRTARARAEIPEVEEHIACLRNIAELYETELSGRPRRQPLEHDIQAALLQYGNLRSAGTGEIVLAERQRLRALTIHLPVLGAEDLVNEEAALRKMHARIDQREAELQSLKVSTLVNFSVPENLATLVANFGVDMQPVEEPEQPPAAPADTPQASGGAHGSASA
ncbi:TPA: hypothetical protein QDB04_000314 [Burkholderia vietnamiensis]|nr:hypothetical protein [Burkholderia vietnamiensis]